MDTRRMRIAAIDQEIAQLQTEREKLAASLVFPVITLPVEITSEIFICCLPDNSLDPTAFDAAAVLGHVCHQWRDIALSIPQLWSSWSLAMDGNTSLSRISSSVQLWLARSQNRPLSIRIHHRDCTGPFDVSYADERWWERASGSAHDVLPFILQHHQRWKSIELNMPITFLQPLASLDPNDELPLLEHLALGSFQDDWGSSVNALDLLMLFERAPQLRSLHITMEGSHLSGLDHVRLPFNQLTSFTGTMFSALECVFLLAQAPALVECVFYIGKRVPISHFISDTELLHLKSLQLWSTAEKVHPIIVLERLTLPRLKTLVLGREESSLPPALEELVARSGCSITHFSCESVEPEELAECLEALPTLSTLELRGYGQKEVTDVIHNLHDRLEANDPPLVLHLEGITLQCEKNRHDGDFFFNALLLMLDTMSRRPTPVRSARLTWTTSLLPRRPNADELNGFNDLVEGGMDIHVGTEEISWV
ncbi:hypothetical protein C8R44DRAFT_383677 [Mycena epipterygia]|nr:hypothetical protein C8R44DRAFT_383677 [Mycena epipterygia]